jgi:hypothetical protein
VHEIGPQHMRPFYAAPPQRIFIFSDEERNGILRHDQTCSDLAYSQTA